MAQKVSTAYTTLFDILKTIELLSVGQRTLNFTFTAHGAMQALRFKLLLETGDIGELSYSPYYEFAPELDADKLLTPERSLTIVNAFMQNANRYQPAALEALSGLMGGLMNVVQVDSLNLNYVNRLSERARKSNPPKYNNLVIKGALLEDGKPTGRIELQLYVPVKSDQQRNHELAVMAMRKQAELRAAADAGDTDEVARLQPELESAMQAVQESPA